MIMVVVVTIPPAHPIMNAGAHVSAVAAAREKGKNKTDEQ